MRVVRRVDEMKSLCAGFRSSGGTVGFVPTMGALHEGHLSLLKIAQQRSAVSVMSIFVNPIQFGPMEDFARYPRPFDADCDLAKANGCDLLFAPPAEEMYPEGYCTFVDVERITKRLCGTARPGHFRGVATVVLKFFNIVGPSVAVFGQKDCQQAVVLKRMVEDLNCPVEIVVAPTMRESDGLAMSSRNAYLTPAERSGATAIFRGLTAARELHARGERSAARLVRTVSALFAQQEMFAVEYMEMVDPRSLEPVETLSGAALLAVAVRTRETRTRLIDNIVLGGEL